MVKPLSFKGDKKSRKRKAPSGDDNDAADSSSKALTVSNIAATGEDDNSWVTAEAPSDIIGPVILILPSAKPTCISCDANGKVFTSELENIFESDPATAEPHEVRQVWVASRVAGTDSISFKGHHGR
jgi:protein FRG1